MLLLTVSAVRTIHEIISIVFIFDSFVSDDDDIGA